jgi:hypothetical protein
MNEQNPNDNSNQKKYDISKTNFFAKEEDKKDSNIQLPQNSGFINTPLSSNYPQNIIDSQNKIYTNQTSMSQSNFFPQQNNNIYSNSNFFPPSQYQLNNPYQIPNQNQFNYQNSQNFYASPPSSSQTQPQQSQSFFQKVSSSAMNLIKKEDPLNLINDINTKDFEENIKNSNKEVQCQILEKTKINDIQVKSIISNPRKISDSLVKNSYLLYDITTEKLNWFVNRRYSDFVWLREALCALFPSTFVPQLPKKKMGNRRFEEDFVEKRLKGLQFFLDEVLKSEILKAADPLITFLSCAERGFFEQQMKVITPKMINVDSIIGIKSFNGKVTVADLDNEFFNNSNGYFNTVENFFITQSDLIKNIKDNLNNYNIHIVEACKNLEEIENGFSKLSQYYSKANLAKDICNVFEQYQIFFKNWKRVNINQTCIIRAKLSDYFKYLKNNGLSLIELLEKQSNVQKNYQKIKDELMNKKEGYWKKMDITKWEMNPMDQIDSALLFRDKNYAFSKMCFQETISLNNKGDLVGYYISNNIINIKNVLKNIEKYSVDNLVSFSKEMEPTVTDAINVWSNLASNL